jgi:hypothetical protein
VGALAPEHDGDSRAPRARSDDRDLAHALTIVGSQYAP